MPMMPNVPVSMPGAPAMIQQVPTMVQGVQPMPAQVQTQYPGRVGKVGSVQVKKAESVLQKYKDGKTALEKRIVENEQWYKMRHWEYIRKQKVNTGDPEPASAWLLNTIINKHADAMDNMPAPAVLPREEGDKQDAEMLSEVLPCVLEYNHYEQTYSDKWWYKLKNGTGVTGVFWDPSKHNGLGDVEIRKIDLLNLYWEPGIMDIQRSDNVFLVDLVAKDKLKAEYDFLKGSLDKGNLDTAKYVLDDTIDTEEKALVVDWYYKIKNGTKTVLHYVKFCNGQVLYASENDPALTERGWYDHGQYPFVFDVLFPIEGMLTGFGYVDICKGPQLFIDKLDQQILKTAVKAARRRPIVKDNGGFNEQEYADLTTDIIHYSGTGNPNESIMFEPEANIPAICENVRLNKVEELKETAGNRDFSQGGTTQGVTAASAIAALQESGSKTNRDSNKGSYRAFEQECYLSIELFRQFYDEARFFRIKGKIGDTKFVAFSNQNIAMRPQGTDFGVDTGYRMPIFDINVTAQKSSPFSTVAQNERAKELYGLGFFNPQMADQALAALEMMDFEGIENVRQKISQNSMMMQMIQMVLPLTLQMAGQLDAIQGTQYMPQVAQMVTMMGAAGAVAMPAGPVGGAEAKPDMQVNQLGNAVKQSENSTAAKARTRAASGSTPRV